MRSRILVDLVYVEWGSQYRSASLSEALRCIAMAGGKVDRLVIADNKLECRPFECRHARTVAVVPGDNTAREFSGWDAAYRSMGPPRGAQAGAAQVLLFVNDTFSAHRRARLSRRIRIASWLRTAARSPEPELFGPLDPFGEPSAWPLGTLSHYITSYLFGMNPQAAEKLLPFCQVDAQLDSFLAPAFSGKGLFTDQLPDAYKDRINEWLLTPGNWRNAAPLTADNFTFFRLKAKSVLYEYALTSRALAAGVCVSDLFSGRDWADRLAGTAARWWMDTVTVRRHPWLRKLDGKGLLRRVHAGGSKV